MRRALSILAVLALMIGSMAMINVNDTQDQDTITCDDCAHTKDRRKEKVASATCDDCAHTKDRRKEQLASATCDDCAHTKDRRKEKVA